MPRGRSGLPRPPSRGQTRSAAVNKGQQGARRRRTDSAKPQPAVRFNSLREGQAPSARSSSPTPRQVEVEPGGLAGFARGISQNFGRGVAEVGRQVGSVVPKSGSRTDPLGGNSLGRAVNQAKGKSWINR